MNEIGQIIRKERDRRTWTQEHVAQEIGTTSQNVSRWERGKTAPDTHYRQRLCELFSLTAEEFGFFHDEQGASLKSQVFHKDECFTPLFYTDQSRSGENSTPSPTLQAQRNWWGWPREWLICSGIFVILSLSLLTTNIIVIATNMHTNQVAITTAPQQRRLPPNVDGWYAKGNVLDMRRSTEKVKNSSHALKVTFSSRSEHDFPFVAQELQPSANVHAGQTISVDLYVPAGVATINASIFAVDTRFRWWKETQAVTFSHEGWYTLQYTIPKAFPGPGKQVGIQFGSEPFNREELVYISTMQWNS